MLKISCRLELFQHTKLLLLLSKCVSACKVELFSKNDAKKTQLLTR